MLNLQMYYTINFTSIVSRETMFSLTSRLFVTMSMILNTLHVISMTRNLQEKIHWIGINRPSMDPGTAVRSVTRHSFTRQVWSSM